MAEMFLHTGPGDSPAAPAAAADTAGGRRGILRGICLSEKRGTKKTEVLRAVLVKDHGIEGDAHAGRWHRQVSLLSAEKIEAFRQKGAEVGYGDFGENLIVEGFDFRTLPVGTRFRIGDAVLEMTQIGKECHSHCTIYKQMGDCIMPREGVFAEVIEGGEIRVGDPVEQLPPDPERQLTAAVVTLSDKGYRGEREDKSGPAIVEILEKNGFRIAKADRMCPADRYFWGVEGTRDGGEGV